MMVDELLWRECRLALGKQPPAQIPAKLGKVGENQVLIVDGDALKVRQDKTGDSHMDFVEGGNDLEAAWIKREFGPNVLLIDGNIAPHDWPLILYHEAHERRDMEKGMSYEKAHDRANQGERMLRIRRQKLTSGGVARRGQPAKA